MTIPAQFVLPQIEMYPFLHSQLIDPSVLAQFAFFEHSSSPSSHSSTSVEEYLIDLNNFDRYSKKPRMLHFLAVLKTYKANFF